MSSIMNNQKDSTRILKKFSLAVFIMLACLFMTSSSTEIKKTAKKQSMIGGKRGKFNEKQIILEKGDEIPEANLTVTETVEGEVTNDSTNNLDGKIKNRIKTNLKNFIGNHIQKVQNKTQEEGSNDEVHSRPEPTAETVPQPPAETVTGTIHLTATQPEPENQTVPATESSPETTFIESKKTKVQLKSKSESRLSSKQATDPQREATGNDGFVTGNNNNNNIYNNQPTQPNAVQLQDPKDPYAYANTKQRCTQINCPFPSTCVADYVCKCEAAKANFFEDSINQENPPYYCIYYRKKQLVAFLLEFFIPPIGHFYAGQYLIACFKLILPCVFFFLFAKVENTLAKGIGGAGVCGLGIWWLVDIILYGINYYSDQNKVRLAGW